MTHQNASQEFHPSGDISPGSNAWFSFEEEDNILEYFLNGNDHLHGGSLPPTPECQSVSHSLATAPMSSLPNASSMAMTQHPHHQSIQQQQQQAKLSNVQFGHAIHSNGSGNSNNDGHGHGHGHENTLSNINNNINGGITTSQNYSRPNKSRNMSSMQPPPTPAVQHFYARPSNSSTSATISSNDKSKSPRSSSSSSALQHNEQSQQRQQHQPLSILYQPGGNNRLGNNALLSSGNTGQGQQPPASTSSTPSPVSAAVYQATNGTSPILHVHQQFQNSKLNHLAISGVTTASGPVAIATSQGAVTTGQPPAITNNNVSPISPAGMCTSEVMILPPPNGHHSTQPNTSMHSNIQHHHSSSSSTTAPLKVTSTTAQFPQNHMTHASWLHHVNNMAMNNSLQSQQQQPMPAPTAPQSTYFSSNTLSNISNSTNNQASAQQPQQSRIYIASVPSQTSNSLITDILPTPSATTHHQVNHNHPNHHTHIQHSHHNTHIHPAHTHLQHPHFQINNLHPSTSISNNIYPQPTSLSPTPSSSSSNIFGTMSLAAAAAGSNVAPVIESKEKRERRLARNRESARQSRRRKKELLLNLEAQVNKLHTNIECERRRQISIMEKELLHCKTQILKQQVKEQEQEQQNGEEGGMIDQSDEKEQDIELSNTMRSLVRESSPNIGYRRTVAEFQYSALRQLILPYYQQLILSMSLNEELFFTQPKEERSKTNKGTGRISSKIVGEEIYKSNIKEKSSQSCDVHDGDKVWPLFCYELTVSLDQEERFLHVFRRMREEVSMPENRSKVSTAITMVSSLRDGIVSRSHSAAHRNEVGLLQVLTPAQSHRFLKWFLANKHRCSKLLGQMEKQQQEQQQQQKNNDLNENNTNVLCENSGNNTGLMKTSNSLSDICQQLTQALEIQNCMVLDRSTETRNN